MKEYHVGAELAPEQVKGKMQAADFTGWYVQEREEGPLREITATGNTDIKRLHKNMVA
ncbi:hypothetical protein FACS1894151_07550 [Spirochaetia bacterium]|nr:hypothetical protein FACS1894151_07550 [Spirochaetia bacterium]